MTQPPPEQPAEQTGMLWITHEDGGLRPPTHWPHIDQDAQPQPQPDPYWGSGGMMHSILAGVHRLFGGRRP